LGRHGAGTGLYTTDAKSCGPVTGDVDVIQPPVLYNQCSPVTTAIGVMVETATVTIQQQAEQHHTAIPLTERPTTGVLQAYLQEQHRLIASLMRNLVDQ
jgi:hypothetical protein